jgi:ERCC4-type nuclease
LTVARERRPRAAFAVAPLTIIIDSREQLPYTFEGLVDDAGPHPTGLPLRVPAVRRALPVGDYGVLGLPRVVVERKSLGDFYSSLARRRENFRDRVVRMHESCDFAAVVVEAEFREAYLDPPPFSELNPKSMSRTVTAWRVRYPRVHWLFLWSRAAAESMTYRILERYWMEHRGGFTPDGH